MATHNKVLAFVKRAARYIGGSWAKFRHVRWGIAGALVLGVLVMNALGALGPTQRASAAGETYAWVDKYTIRAAGGAINSPVNLKDTVNSGPPSNTLEGNVTVGSGCTMTLILTVDPLGRNAAKITTANEKNCGQQILGQFAGQDIKLQNVPASFLDPGQTIPLGCPGGPAGPVLPTANYPCPGGGAVVNGVYFADATVGRVQGHITFKDGNNTGPCPNTPITVNRISGNNTAQNAPTTAGTGQYIIDPLGQGQVTLSVNNCTAPNGNVYSGQSQTITVPANQLITVDFSVSTLVASATSTATCDNAGYTDINFFLCGFINALSDSAKGLDQAIVGLLKINVDQIFNDSGTQKTGDSYFVAWAAFRDIAYAILVVLALIMIASQVLGLDVFDAYTIRKMLPRLIMATILIALSWNIMDFVFNMANDAADAVMAIIAAPFSHIDVTIGNNVSNDLTIAILIPVILTAAGTGLQVLAIMGPGGIAALIASILLSVLSVWILLVARDIIATILVIMSPIAIIAWALGR